MNTARFFQSLPMLLITALLAFSPCRRAWAESGSTTPPGEDTAKTESSSSDAVQLARKHFLRGVEFYKNGDYKLALVEFRRSHELSSNYRILYNIGQVNHQLSNYTKALAALEEYLAKGENNVSEERRAEVVADIAELRTKIARINLKLNVAGAELIIDDVPTGTVQRMHSVVVDAGDHRIEVRRAGYQPARAQVSSASGDTTEVSLVLAPVKPAAPPSSPRGDAEVKSKSSPLIVVGWVATGIFAVSAGVTGALAVGEANELAALRESPSSTPGERDAASDRARMFATASDVLTVTAVIAGAASLYVTLGSGSRERPRTAATRLGLSPTGVTFAHTY